MISLEAPGCSYSGSSQDLELNSRIQRLIHCTSIIYYSNPSALIFSVNQASLHTRYRQNLIQQTPPNLLLSRLSEELPVTQHERPSQQIKIRDEFICIPHSRFGLPVHSVSSHALKLPSSVPISRQPQRPFWFGRLQLNGPIEGRWFRLPLQRLSERYGQCCRCVSGNMECWRHIQLYPRR